jgi:serine/threonine protein kinase/Tol biopolymer transport system component
MNPGAIIPTPRMAPERWQRIEQLYHAALEQTPERRSAFLEEASGGDEELRREVESLLEQPDAGVLDEPVWQESDASLRLGAKLGPYEILEPIGAGGMGAVYKARDSRLNRTVAIKVSSARFSGRFKREAHAIAALNHPYICTLYDVGPDYLVMEYVDGHPLKGPLLQLDFLRYAVQIADALDAAHRQGIVHRDLKPANILVSKAGVKLLDFGLAKMAVRPEDKTETGVTAGGTVIGTLHYMSPEQVQGKNFDARSDIFSFGAVMVEMITGKRAFDGDNTASVISAIMTADPKALQGADIPAALERVVRRCLAKDPDDRWQTARDLLAELRWIQEGPTAVGVPAERIGRKWWALGAVAAVIAIGSAWVLTSRFGSTTQPAQTIRSSLLPPPGFSFVPNYFAVSPDGAHLAFVAMAADGATALWVRSLSGATAQQLNGTENAWHPFWSPDSGRIGFFADGRLKTVDIAGGAVQILTDTRGLWGGSWNRDGTILMGGGQMLHRVPAAGGAKAEATRRRSKSQAHRWPWFLPDGTHFLYLVDWSAQGDSPGDGIYAGSLENQDAKPVLPDLRGNAIFASGNLLYVSSRSLLAQPFDPRKLEITGPAVPIATQELEEGPNYGYGFSASENGSIVFQSAADSPAQMIWFDRSGKELGQIPQTGYLDPSLSPDGNLLAVSSDEEHNGKHFVRIIDLRTGIVTGLTQGGDEHNPCWTPDGKFVTYRSGTNQTASIEHVPVDRSSPARTLLRGFNVKPNSWSHDGHLLYTDFSLNGPARKSYSASTGEAVPVDDEAESQHSPDGKWVAVSGTNVFVQLAKGPGRRIQVSSGPAGGYQPRWSHDGKRIFYIQTDRKLMEADFDGEKGIASAPHLLFQTHIIQSRATLPQYDVAPDGRFLINSFPAGNGAPLTLLTGWTALLKKH